MISCCIGVCWRWRWRAAGGTRSAIPSTAPGWTVSRSDWPATRVATCTGFLWRLGGCGGCDRRTAKFFATYDAVLTPTLAEPTPRVGYLDPTADYHQVMDRLTSWVAYTPLQNVTGEPAISLPLSESADGMPVGMMLSAAMGQEALLLELAYRTRSGPAVGADPSRPVIASVGSEPVEHAFELALLGFAEFAQDAGVGGADGAFRTFQQGFARSGQCGR